jgi:hypothetical protein
MSPPSVAPTAPKLVPDPPMDTSSAERKLLDSARQALSRGDPEAAWGSVQEHEHEFPRGQLSEEREALAVRTLVAFGRDAAAGQRAARMHASFPRSIFLPAVDSALATLVAADGGL